MTTEQFLGYTALLHRGRCDLRWVDYSTVRRMITTMSARRHHSGLVHVIGTTISLWISMLVHYFVENGDDDAVDHWCQLVDYFGDVKVTTGDTGTLCVDLTVIGSTDLNYDDQF